MPIQDEGAQPCEILSVLFGRHPADGNVTVDVPSMEAQVNFGLSPNVYMNRDFLDNYLHYVSVVTTKRKFSPDELANAVIIAAEFLGFDQVMPAVEGDKMTANIAVVWNEGFPQSEEAKAKGLFMEGLLFVVEADPECFKQTVKITRMAGLAAMAAGKFFEDKAAEHSDKAETPGRRLSDAMPPSSSKH